MRKKVLGLLLALTLVFSLVPLMTVSPTALAAPPTTTITVTKLASDGTTVLDQTTVTWEWMRDNLPVQGDGVTHYYHQGPTFDAGDMWDQGETTNVDSRDYGAAMGTDVKDLCELLPSGGASAGSVIKIKSSDGFSKSFGYEDVYNPEPDQGRLVVTWYTDGTGDGMSGYVPDYNTGMRLLFFAETLNPDGKLVFGNWDMHETLAEEYWHYYYDGSTLWPSSSGLSVKWVSEIIIYSDETPSTPPEEEPPDEEPPEEQGGASDSLIATVNVVGPMIGILLDRDSIEYGDVGPGQSSAVQTVGITNIGTVDVNTTLEVQGADSVAQEFYEQSLYIDYTLYDPAAVIATIPTGNSQDVDTQLNVPPTWSELGVQEATFIFWAEAA